MDPVCAMALEWPIEPAQPGFPSVWTFLRRSGARWYCIRVRLRIESMTLPHELPHFPLTMLPVLDATPVDPPDAARA